MASFILVSGDMNSTVGKWGSIASGHETPNVYISDTTTRKSQIVAQLAYLVYMMLQTAPPQLLSLWIQ